MKWNTNKTKKNNLLAFVEQSAIVYELEVEQIKAVDLGDLRILFFFLQVHIQSFQSIICSFVLRWPCAVDRTLKSKN